MYSIFLIMKSLDLFFFFKGKKMCALDYSNLFRNEKSFSKQLASEIYSIVLNLKLLRENVTPYSNSPVPC